MKKIFALLLVLMLLPCLAFAESMVIHITTTSTDAADIGENWTAYYSLDGSELTDGALFEIPEGTILLGAELTENDSTPDVGTMESVCNVTPYKLAHGFVAYQDVAVTENKGRNRGVTVYWTVRYDFTPVGSVYVLMP